MLNPKLKKQLYLEHSNTFRTSLSRMIDEGKLTIKNCDIVTLLDNAKIIRSNTASETLKVLGDLVFTVHGKRYQSHMFKDDVFLKLSFTSLSDDDNSLEVEREIYKTIINRLIFERLTPHVIMYIGSFTCTNFLNILSKESTKSQLGKELNEEVLIMMEDNIKQGSADPTNPIYDYNEANFLILEKAQGMSLLDLFSGKTKENPSGLDITSIVFQVLYTLQVFEIYGLQHNDLHTGNILVDVVKPRNIVYFISNSMYFVIPVKYFVKIFDFDLSNTTKLRNNKLDSANFCESYGICNERNPKFDRYTFACFLNELHLDIAKFLALKIVTDIYLLKESFGFPCRLCKIKGRIGNVTKCEGQYVPNNNVMPPIEKVIGNVAFGRLSYKVNNIPDILTQSYSLFMGSMGQGYDMDPMYDPTNPDNQVYFWPNVDTAKLFKDIKNATPLKFKPPQ